MIILFAFAPLASSAFEGASREANPFGVEVQGFFISQDDNGDTLTLLPMIDFSFLSYGEFSLQAQLGATLLKDFPEHRFWSSVFRLAPTYMPSENFSIELPLGVQWWEGEGVKADLGARFVYQISQPWVDDIFAGGGWISDDKTTYHLSLGVRKWF